MGDDLQLTDVVIGDDPTAWTAAGFSVTADGDGPKVTIGKTAIRLVGSSGRRGIHSIAIDGLAGDLDGIAVSAGSATELAPAHSNGIDRWDHLVVMTPDSDRTTQAYEAAGLAARRVRRFEMGGTPSRQTFFWLGDVILELAGPDAASGDGPSTAWGIAVTTPDFDASVAALGDRCGRVKDAVQTGRRIATIRTRDVDISVPIALMTPHRSA